ncbi:MAG: cytochrome c oxidase subunit II [Planctomycetes bacterium]|nr:cytochrome c oxidase subunit II [Planctomycetota bacterium]
MNPLKWMLPPQKSNFAGDVDWLFYYITWVSIFFFVLILVLMIAFVIKYRRRDPNDPPGEGPEHHLPLEITWTVIPLILVIFMFYWGMVGANEMATPPANAYDIQVSAQQWSWQFTYPNAKSDKDLHIPPGQPVVLTMTSQDVLHAFYVPAFRVKNDIVPKKYSKVWFTCDSPGDYQVFCAEYCGTDHSNMRARAIVYESREAFEAKMAILDIRPEGRSLEEHGKIMHTDKGCAQCHITTTPKPGQILLAPSWRNLSRDFGQLREFTDGSRQIVDEAYVRESMRTPSKKIVAGFGPTMPVPTLTQDQEDSIVAFIKSLKDTPEE